MKKVQRIVKVQQSLASSDDTKSVLIYTEDRKHMLEMAMPPELAEFMGDEPKVYFIALVPEDEPGMIELQEPVGEQDW